MTSTPSLDVTAAGAPTRRSARLTRTSSIRSRWNRSFAFLLIVLAMSGLVGLGANHRVVQDYRSRAEQLETEASRLATLRANLATHTRAGHGLMERPDPVATNEAADRAASIGVTFKRVIDESADTETRRLFESAHARWREAIATIAEIQPSASVEATLEAHKSLAEHSDATVALLDEAGVAGRAAARAGLERAEDVQRISTAASLVMFAAVLVLVVLMGLRFSADVLRPVSRLRVSAERLAAGDLDHRVDLGRRAIGDGDELAALTVSFNTMAEAVARTHHLLTRQAHHDSLTGLANRAAFRARLDAALSHAQRRNGTLAVLFVDLDDFKDVNDTLGHSAGDELLTVVAARLADAVRPGDLAARLGGDEFAVLLDGVADPAAALAVAERAVAALALPVGLGDGSLVHVSASVGLAMRHDDSDPDGLMQQADSAMYLAKGRGKNRVERYDAALHAADADHCNVSVPMGGFG